MLEEENKQEIKIINQEEELNEAIDESVALLPLDEQEEKIVSNIIKAPSQKELQTQFDLFNINQSKKNALRIIKLNSLLDKVEDQAIERFEKRPDQVSNKELLDYMQVVATQIDRSQKFIDTLKDKPMIKVTDKSQNVNINIGTELNRDSKERVMDAIQVLLKQLNKPEEKDIIEADFSNNDEKNVYNIETEEDQDISDSAESLLYEDEGEK